MGGIIKRKNVYMETHTVKNKAPSIKSLLVRSSNIHKHAKNHQLLSLFPFLLRAAPFSGSPTDG
jgi:hypothetical protein